MTAITRKEPIMNTNTILFAAALCSMLPGVASAQTATAETPAEAAATETPGGRTFELDFEGAAGAQAKEVSGSREKFEEYGDVEEGFVLERLQSRYQRQASGDFLELGVRDAGQDDESYRLALGRRGRYRVSVSYDAMPHLFSGGTFLWNGFGTGRLQIADVVQSQLQANEQEALERSGGVTFTPALDPRTDTTGEDAIQRGIVQGLYPAANPVRFGLERRQAGASLEVDLTPEVSAWIRVLNENRDGARVINAGSYERWFVGGGSTGHTQDRFIVLGAELAEPIDHRTLGVAAGAGMHRERWLADVEYTLTQFRNFNDTLLWDNPFRISDDDTNSGNAFDRSRFAVGQLVLPPNSIAHDVTATGAVDLPMRGRLAASLSYGMITQDEAFQPYTRNTAVIATDAAGNDVGPAPFAVLPAGDLDGDVRTVAGTLSASVRPLRPLGISAKYRLYRYDGKSAEITWPGYAGFGESVWRRQRNDPAGAGPFTNEVFDYWRHEADLDVDYRLSRALSVSVMGGWEGWRYEHLRLDRLDEYSAGAGFTIRPARNASLRATYRFSDRENDGYLRGNTGENPEARGLLNFNWADRRRHVADARVRYSPSRIVSFGVLGSFMDEEYGGETLGGTVIDQFRFGRTDVTRWLGSADVTVNPAERLSVHANYTIERREEQMANAAKDNADKALDDFFDPSGAPIPDNFTPENYWDSDITDTINSLGIGATVFIVPDRLSLEAGYNLSFSDVEVDTSNPSPGVFTAPDPDLMLLNAVAQGWPTITNRLHEVIVELAFRLTPNVRTGARYLFASYDLDDFAWNIMTPYMADTSAENSTRYVFADATYNDYQAHVGTLYIAGSF
jgi:MtrB/PioB family decaheme-associated outer membrane protein